MSHPELMGMLTEGNRICIKSIASQDIFATTLNYSKYIKSSNVFIDDVDKYLDLLDIKISEIYKHIIILKSLTYTINDIIEDYQKQLKKSNIKSIPYKFDIESVQFDMYTIEIPFTIMSQDVISTKENKDYIENVFNIIKSMTDVYDQVRLLHECNNHSVSDIFVKCLMMLNDIDEDFVKSVSPELEMILQNMIQTIKKVSLVDREFYTLITDMIKIIDNKFIFRQCKNKK